MFSLIIQIIVIALVAPLVVSVIHCGGSDLFEGEFSSDASEIVQNLEEVHIANLFYQLKSKSGKSAPDLESLSTLDYVESSCNTCRFCDFIVPDYVADTDKITATTLIRTSVASSENAQEMESTCKAHNDLFGDLFGIDDLVFTSSDLKKAGFSDPVLYSLAQTQAYERHIVTYCATFEEGEHVTYIHVTAASPDPEQKFLTQYLLRKRL